MTDADDLRDIISWQKEERIRKAAEEAENKAAGEAANKAVEEAVKAEKNAEEAANKAAEEAVKAAEEVAEEKARKLEALRLEREIQDTKRLLQKHYDFVIPHITAHFKNSDSILVIDPTSFCGAQHAGQYLSPNSQNTYQSLPELPNVWIQNVGEGDNEVFYIRGELKKYGIEGGRTGFYPTGLEGVEEMPLTEIMCDKLRRIITTDPDADYTYYWNVDPKSMTKIWMNRVVFEGQKKPHAYASIWKKPWIADPNPEHRWIIANLCDGELSFEYEFKSSSHISLRAWGDKLCLTQRPPSGLTSLVSYFEPDVPPNGAWIQYDGGACGACWGVTDAPSDDVEQQRIEPDSEFPIVCRYWVERAGYHAGLHSCRHMAFFPNIPSQIELNALQSFYGSFDLKVRIVPGRKPIEQQAAYSLEIM